jgi:hypothetical protein
MKNFENLGKKLSKDEQKNILGGGSFIPCSNQNEPCGISGGGMAYCCPGLVCIGDVCSLPA